MSIIEKILGAQIMEEGKNAKENASARKRHCVANFVHIVLIAALILYTFYAVIADGGMTAQNFWGGLLECLMLAGINDIFTFIGALAFILFGIVGIYEFAYTNGLRKLLPPFYLRFREERDEKTARTMMKTYYEQDIEFIQQYEQERANRILQALGIKEKQFRHIQYELVRARIMPQRTQKEMVAKLEPMIYEGGFIIDQSAIPPERRVYPNVDYFINLYTALYDSELCADVGNLMASYVFRKVGIKLANIDYIVVPYGSNLLLGLEVGKRLEKPVIAVQEKPRIIQDEFWDGNYRWEPDRKNHIIIIHDVLVTGERIYRSIEKLPAGTYIVDGLFCLIQYDHKQFQPEETLHSHGIHRIECLMHTDERSLREAKKTSNKVRKDS